MNHKHKSRELQCNVTSIKNNRTKRMDSQIRLERKSIVEFIEQFINIIVFDRSSNGNICACALLLLSVCIFDLDDAELPIKS